MVLKLGYQVKEGSKHIIVFGANGLVTTLPRGKIKSGTLTAILKQLGIDRNELDNLLRDRESPFDTRTLHRVVAGSFSLTQPYETKRTDPKRKRLSRSPEYTWYEEARHTLLPPMPSRSAHYSKENHGSPATIPVDHSPSLRGLTITSAEDISDTGAPRPNTLHQDQAVVDCMAGWCEHPRAH